MTIRLTGIWKPGGSSLVRLPESTLKLRSNELYKVNAPLSNRQADNNVYQSEDLPKWFAEYLVLLELVRAGILSLLNETTRNCCWIMFPAHDVLFYGKTHPTCGKPVRVTRNGKDQTTRRNIKTLYWPCVWEKKVRSNCIHGGRRYGLVNAHVVAEGPTTSTEDFYWFIKIINMFFIAYVLTFLTNKLIEYDCFKR